MARERDARKDSIGGDDRPVEEPPYSTQPTPSATLTYQVPGNFFRWVVTRTTDRRDSSRYIATVGSEGCAS